MAKIGPTPITEMKPKQSRYSPDEDKIIKILKDNGVNSTSIASALGRSRSSIVQRALKLGFTFQTTRNELPEKTAIILKKLKGRKSNKIWETISTNIVINKLAINGLRPFKPVTSNVEEDLLVYNGKKILKIQIKCASLIDKHSTSIHWQNVSANFFHQERETNKNTTKYKYPNIDFIIVNCMGTDHTYVIPNTILKNRTKINLRYFPDIIRYYKLDSLRVDTDKYLEKYELLK